MPVKIRLQRHGKKGKPFYWIVAADARATRDGKYLEKLGIYNPNTNPATIELGLDNAVKWLQNGAQPTETVRNILSYKGAMLKNHLAGGVRKGALTEEQAEEKFNAWMEEKETKINTKKENLSKADQETKAKAVAAEKEVNAKRESEAKAAEDEAKAAAEAEVEEAEIAKVTEEVSEETPTVEEVAPVEESKPEAKEEKVEVKEEKTEAKEEVKAEEPKAEKETEAKAEEESKK